MVFKVIIMGDTRDGSVFMRITTSSTERVEYLKRFCNKNKYKYKVEMIEE